MDGDVEEEDSFPLKTGSEGAIVLVVVVGVVMFDDVCSGSDEDEDVPTRMVPSLRARIPRRGGRRRC